MPNNISEAVNDQLDKQYAIMPLILFELPDMIRGYYGGPHPYPYNGQVYLPNAFLQVDELIETLDDDLNERNCTFSNIPVENDDLISDLTNIRYTGARVTVSRLILDPKTHKEVGIGETTFHEVYDASLNVEPDGEEEEFATIEITLRAPGFIGRRQTNTVRSLAEHQRDFDATDTFYEHITEVTSIQREWGQRSG